MGMSRRRAGSGARSPARREMRLSDVAIVAGLYVLVIVFYLTDFGTETADRKGAFILVSAPFVLPFCAFKAVQIMRLREREGSGRKSDGNG